MEYIMKRINSLEDYILLLKRVGEAIQNEANEPNGRFLAILFDTLGTSLLGMC